MKYRRRKKPSVKITREDIEKAMSEYEGEITYLKVETEKTYQSNPAKSLHPFQSRFSKND